MNVYRTQLIQGASNKVLDDVHNLKKEHFSYRNVISRCQSVHIPNLFSYKWTSIIVANIINIIGQILQYCTDIFKCL